MPVQLTSLSIALQLPLLTEIIHYNITRSHCIMGTTVLHPVQARSLICGSLFLLSYLSQFKNSLFLYKLNIFNKTYEQSSKPTQMLSSTLKLQSCASQNWNVSWSLKAPQQRQQRHLQWADPERLTSSSCSAVQAASCGPSWRSSSSSCSGSSPACRSSSTARIFRQAAVFSSRLQGHSERVTFLVNVLTN